MEQRYLVWSTVFMHLNTAIYEIRNRGPFLECPGNFSGLESCFMFTVYAFKIKVSIILKMIQWNYQLTKQNWPVCVLLSVLIFSRIWFLNLLLSRKVTGPIEKGATQEHPRTPRSTQEHPPRHGGTPSPPPPNTFKYKNQIINFFYR